MLMCLIENPFLIAKYSEELGKIRFNDLNLSSLVSEILEFSASNIDKELENFDLKSYLNDRGLNQEITYIFQPKLLFFVWVQHFATPYLQTIFRNLHIKQTQLF